MIKNTVEPQKDDGDKRRDVPFVHGFGEKKTTIKGKIWPKRIELNPSLAGEGTEAPGQPRHSTREMQQTAVDGYTLADGSSKLGENHLSSRYCRGETWQPNV